MNKFVPVENPLDKLELMTKGEQNQNDLLLLFEIPES
jgi:hypothetical protein